MVVVGERVVCNRLETGGRRLEEIYLLAQCPQKPVKHFASSWTDNLCAFFLQPPVSGLQPVRAGAVGLYFIDRERIADDVLGEAFHVLAVAGGELVRWVLSWMPDVEVLAPQSLHDRVREKLRVALGAAT